MKFFSRFNTSIITVWGLIVGLSLLRAARLPELDVLWGSVNGTDILKGMSITHPIDYWNFQTYGETWSPNSWLWHVLLSVSYQNLGTFGFWVIVFVSNITILTLAWVFLRKNQIEPNWHPYIILTFGILLILFLNGRSNTADVILLMVFITVTNFIVCLKKPKITQIVVPVFAGILSILWINFHLTGVLAVILFPAFTWLFLRNTPVKQRVWVSILVFFTSSLGNLCSPFGSTVYSKMFLVRDESTGLISEWGPVVQPFEIFWLHIVGIILTIVLIIVLLKQRKELLYVVFLSVLTMQSIFVSRYAMYLMVAAFVAVPLLSWKAPVKQFPQKLFVLSARMVAGVVLCVGLGVNVLTLVDNDSYFPVAVSDFGYVPEGARVLASQHTGSALILYRPDTLVALDGRNDLIGKERMITPYQMFFSNDENFVKNWFESHHVNVVFLDKDQDDNASPLIERLERWGWVKFDTKRSLIFVDKP